MDILITRGGLWTSMDVIIVDLIHTNMVQLTSMTTTHVANDGCSRKDMIICWLNIRFRFHSCHNLSLGLATKARAYKGEGHEGSSKVTSHAPGSVEECEWMNLTLTNELPLWELESQWTPKFLERNCKGQNPLDLNIIYIIGKPLESQCLK
jgi:hypothetical protein